MAAVPREASETCRFTGRCGLLRGDADGVSRPSHRRLEQRGRRQALAFAGSAQRRQHVELAVLQTIAREQRRLEQAEQQRIAKANSSNSKAAGTKSVASTTKAVSTPTRRSPGMCWR